MLKSSFHLMALLQTMATIPLVNMLQLTNVAEEGYWTGVSCELAAAPFSVYWQLQNEFSGRSLSLARNSMDLIFGETPL